MSRVARKFDKITDATAYPAGNGLMWVETVDYDSNDEYVQNESWLLIESATDRVLVSIDGPSEHQFSYGVNIEGGARRCYITEESAKRYAFGAAIEKLTEESAQRSSARKARRGSKS